MSADLAHANDGMGVDVAASFSDSPTWHAHLKIEKYADDEAYARGETYEVIECPGNLLTTAGLGRIATLVTAGTGNLISSTTARVGAGNGVTAEAVGNTDLAAAAGSANRWFQTCTVTIPSNVWTFVAVFGTADGNFAWNEWGIDIGTATVTSANTVNAVLLNRKTATNGTKAAGQTWTATATITLS